MRNARVWAGLLGVEKTTVERVKFDEDQGVLVAHVRPVRWERRRCGVCPRPSPGYDPGEGRRRWRCLDLGTVRAVLEADAPRVHCAQHGVVVAAVPWARHGTGHTRFFNDQVAWWAVTCSKSAVQELMRIAWAAVGAIITRVAEDAMAGVDRFADLRRIGIDEISDKKGHRYLTVVVNHDSRRLIWAAPGRDNATLGQFFELLGPDRCAQLTHVSADAADWIADVVAQRCADAVRCAEAFHVVAWATEALDEVRRQAWNDARALARGEPRRGRGRPRADAAPRPGHEQARNLKNARYALWKNPENLTDRQADKLAQIAQTDPRLHRAYLLLAPVFRIPQPGHDEGAAPAQPAGTAPQPPVRTPTNSVEVPGIEPGSSVASQGLLRAQSACLYSDPPVMRTSRCDDPSRCLVFRAAPRPARTVSPLADAGHRSGNIPGPTATLPAQAARANAVRVSAALIFLRHLVNEIIVAFLGTLPLDLHPESKPFTPLPPAMAGPYSITRPGRRIIPAGQRPTSRAGGWDVVVGPGRLRQGYRFSRARPFRARPIARAMSRCASRVARSVRLS